MTTEEKIVELENNCKAMTEEIEKLKAELAEKNETVWIPEKGDLYAYVTSDGIVVKNATYYNDNMLDSDRIDFNNAYPSSDKTQKHLEWYCDNVLFVQNKLMQLHELLCPDYFPDWDEVTSVKNYIVYKDTTKQKWTWCGYAQTAFPIVYFTEVAAKKACEILNREKFMVE